MARFFYERLLPGWLIIPSSSVLCTLMYAAHFSVWTLGCVYWCVEPGPLCSQKLRPGFRAAKPLRFVRLQWTLTQRDLSNYSAPTLWRVTAPCDRLGTSQMKSRASSCSVKNFYLLVAKVDVRRRVRSALCHPRLCCSSPSSSLVTRVYYLFRTYIYTSRITRALT